MMVETIFTENSKTDTQVKIIQRSGNQQKLEKFLSNLIKKNEAKSNYIDERFALFK